MKIFRLKHSREAPTVIPVPDPKGFSERMILGSSELKEGTEIGQFQLYDPDQQGDGFFKIFDYFLLFSREILLSDIGSTLGYAGNLHPARLTDTGEELFFLNITARYNCIDKSRSVYYRTMGNDKDVEVGVDHGKGLFKPAFYPSMIGDSSIFRIPEIPFLILIAADRAGLEEEDFYEKYQRSGVRGLSFEEIWNDDNHE